MGRPAGESTEKQTVGQREGGEQEGRKGREEGAKDRKEGWKS